MENDNGVESTADGQGKSRPALLEQLPHYGLAYGVAKGARILGWLSLSISAVFVFMLAVSLIAEHGDLAGAPAIGLLVSLPAGVIFLTLGTMMTAALDTATCTAMIFHLLRAYQNGAESRSR